MATINTARYFGLKDIGAIAPGFKADFVLLDDFELFKISEVFLDGRELNKSKSNINSSSNNNGKDTTIDRNKKTFDNPVITILPSQPSYILQNLFTSKHLMIQICLQFLQRQMNPFHPHAHYCK